MKQIPLYEFDCSLPPAERWAALPMYLRNSGRILTRRAVREYEAIPLMKPMDTILRLATKWRNPYREEIKAVAPILKITRRDAFLTNFHYEINELAHYACGKWESDWVPRFDRIRERISTIADRFIEIRASAIACTAGACRLPDYGMVHVRSLDWPLEGLGRHSLILHHKNNPAGDFYSVGWPGYSGVLSGFKPGCFAASLNMAFILRRPSLDWPPTHLLRWVFEHCGTYAEALEMLKETPVCVPAFILLSSTNRAAVIELAPDGNKVHRARKGDPVAIANAYIDPARRRAMDEWGYDTDSDARCNALLRRMRKARRAGLLPAHQLLRAWPIQHEEAMQQMVFSHATNEMLVVGREDDEEISRRIVLCSAD